MCMPQLATCSWPLRILMARYVTHLEVSAAAAKTSDTKLALLLHSVAGCRASLMHQLSWPGC